MAWDHLSVTRPHLVYLILGGFTALFMLVSSVIKERLYIGEATVATICGIIFGPHAANLINPFTWGNVDLITLEFSRVVLVVQCFAVGVELPRAYMEKHWRSVTLLLIPVMTFGWLITSLFIWWMFRSHLNWLDSLCIAACVTATDPVLASSVVGKGKFAKRVPKHLRDLLSAESGCNDGMAFPFVYLAVYLIRYRPDANKVAFHWFCYTILYECIFGALFGVIVGYAGRRAVRYAHEKDLIDRESFLVFYFVLALFCAGAGSLLGLDDLLVGFACGVGFSNDGWFLEKTEESHVSNVIDLLLNLSFFVYFGTIIPWELFNAPEILGLVPWRLVVLGILVLFFRRIPIMLALKPFIPDIKTWREACFAGHFGPIGVGGLFVAILARAELETESTTPLAELPPPDFPHANVIEMIWPITCFLVICSIIVHGSSIAVFTLGKHINTLSISLSYTKGNEDGPGWMDRLPRIQSRSKSSMSLARRPSDSDLDEKTGANRLPPVGVPGQFLRRQQEEEGSLRPTARRRRWEHGRGAGGPISQSAIAPDRRGRDHVTSAHCVEDSVTLGGPSESPESSLTNEERAVEQEEEFYQEGPDTVIEDEEGNVLGFRHSHPGEGEKERRESDVAEGRRLMREKDVEHGVAQTEHRGLTAEKTPGKMAEAVKDHIEGPSKKKEGSETHGKWKKRMQGIHHRGSRSEDANQLAEPGRAYKPPHKRGPALAYQFGNTIIVEDEDGEVVKKYNMPRQARPGGLERKSSVTETGGRAMQNLRNMGKYVGVPSHQQGRKTPANDDDDDDTIRFTVTAGGRRMSKAEFIQQMSKLEPKSRAKFIEDSDVPEPIKEDAREDARDQARSRAGARRGEENLPPIAVEKDGGMVDAGPEDAHENLSLSPVVGGARAESFIRKSVDEDVPFHSVRDNFANYNFENARKGETAAQRRRRLAEGQGPPMAEASPSPATGKSSPDSGDASSLREQAPKERPRHLSPSDSVSAATRSSGTVIPLTGAGAPESKSRMDEGETEAERKRRLGALGMGGQGEEESSDEEDERGDPFRKVPKRAPGIRFAEQPRMPTKDERVEEEEREKESEGGKLLGKLKWRK